VSACSPPLDPTIAALGPRQVVLVGTTGERVAGGRQFHVERWWNGPDPSTPVVIAFKEGEPTGDCSYPMAPGRRLVIAPQRLDDGTWYADLGTLQADPTSPEGRRYLAEAERLFGPGRIPSGGQEAVVTSTAFPTDVLSGAALLGLLLVGLAWLTVRRADR
jgi:hypothetical protein